MSLGIIYLLSFPPTFVSNFTELQNVFFQSHPSIRLGFLIGLLIAPAVVMIKNGTIRAIGEAIGSFIVVDPKNWRVE